MKQTTTSTLTVIGMVVILAFSNCKKEQATTSAAGRANTARNAAYAQQTNAYTPVSGDRIDEIVSGLSQDSYSISFESTYPAAGITRTAYGADSYLAFADPQDVICPEPFRIRQSRIPLWKIPTFLPPTCPDMIRDPRKIAQLQEVLQKADPVQFGGLQEIKMGDGSVYLASKKFTSQFENMQLDKIDGLTKDLNPQSFLILNAPGNFTGGVTRSFYGYADLNEVVFKRYKLTLKDILKPTLKGCYDPQILDIIRQRLQRFDPATYKGLNVSPLEQDRSIGVLSMN